LFIRYTILKIRSNMWLFFRIPITVYKVFKEGEFRSCIYTLSWKATSTPECSFLGIGRIFPATREVRSGNHIRPIASGSVAAPWAG
jgi:hypothetical protein